MADQFGQQLLKDIKQMERDCHNKAKLIHALRNGGRRDVRTESYELMLHIDQMGKLTDDFIAYTRGEQRFSI